MQDNVISFDVLDDFDEALDALDDFDEYEIARMHNARELLDESF